MSSSLSEANREMVIPALLLCFFLVTVAFIPLGGILPNDGAPLTFYLYVGLSILIEASFLALLLLGSLRLLSFRFGHLVWLAIWVATLTSWFGFILISWHTRLTVGRFFNPNDISLLHYLTEPFVLDWALTSSDKATYLAVVLVGLSAAALFVKIFYVKISHISRKRLSALAISTFILFLFFIVSLTKVSDHVMINRLMFRATPQLTAVLWSILPHEHKSYEPVELVGGQIEPFNIERQSATPNVLLLVVEALRRDAPYFHYDEGAMVMPFLSSMAESEHSFSYVYAQSTDTNRSIKTLLTSAYPRTSVSRESLPSPKAEKSLIQFFNELDYSTSYFGVFDWAQSGTNPLSEGANFYLDPTQSYTHQQLEDKVRNRLLLDSSAPVHPQRIVAELDFINLGDFKDWVSSTEQKNFFSVVYLHSPHYPYTLAAHDKQSAATAEEGLSTYYFPIEWVDKVKQLYKQSLTQADSIIKQYVEFLENSARGQDTVIFIIGDHGEEFYENGHYLHAGPLHAPVTNITGLVLGLPPSCQAELLKSNAIGHIDIAPTLLDLVSGETYPGFQGLSLCRDPQETQIEGRPLFSSSMAFRNQDSVVYKNWKYIRSYDGDPDRMYHLLVDPEEKKDLLEKHPEVASWLREMVLLYRRSQLTYNDPMLPWSQSSYPPQYNYLWIRENLPPEPALIARTTGSQ